MFHFYFITMMSFIQSRVFGWAWTLGIRSCYQHFILQPYDPTAEQRSLSICVNPEYQEMTNRNHSNKGVTSKYLAVAFWPPHSIKVILNMNWMNEVLCFVRKFPFFLFFFFCLHKICNANKLSNFSVFEKLTLRKQFIWISWAVVIRLLYY